SPDAHGGREWVHVLLMQYELNVARYPALALVDFVGARYRSAAEQRILVDAIADLILNGARPKDEQHLYFALGVLLERPELAALALRRAELLGHPAANQIYRQRGIIAYGKVDADRQWARGQ